MNPLTMGIVLVVVVVVVLLCGAWAVGRHRRDNANEADGVPCSPEELKAREDFEELRGRYPWSGLT